MSKDFLAFNTDGDILSLDGKLVRKHGIDVSDSMKAAIRATLGVPGAAEGLVPGNNLSDLASVTAARGNLSVFSKGEVNDRTNARQPSNAGDFGPTGGSQNIGSSSLLSFGDGAGNDKPFTILQRVKVKEITSCTFVKKYGGSGAREYIAQSNGSDELVFFIVDSADREIQARTPALTAYEDEWITVAIVVNPTSALGSRANDIKILINGVAQTMGSIANNASFSGMHDSATDFLFGNTSGNTDFEQSFGAIYNRALSDAEVLEFTVHGTIPVSDQYGGATATSGSLVVGKRYRLTDWITGDDFTNVGAASNTDGVEFVATGTTPTTWSNSSVVTTLGAVAAYLPENILADGSIRDASTNGLHTSASGVSPLSKLQVLEIDAQSPAADSKLLDLKVAGVSKASIDEDGDAVVNNLNISSIPTSSGGLSSGDIWSNSGVLTIVS